MSRKRRALAIDLIALAVLKAALAAWLLHRGFSHVSDDDFARVVIAERFAHAPSLDPSATSWLPFPVWVTGAAMIALGRSLAVARAVAIGLGAASVMPVYLALRSAKVERPSAFAGVVVAMVSPWNAWLGAATVPESFTACLVAAGAIALGSATPRSDAPQGAAIRGWAALGLAAAALSRYEAWAVCGAISLLVLVRALRGRRDRGDLAVVAVCLAAPVAWMLWNAHAHGSSTHFLSRVATYRQALGGSQGGTLEKLATYPRALVGAAPEIAVLAIAGAIVLATDRSLRARWAGPLFAAASVFVFLAYGDLKDGAPTHHPERALVGVVWILAPFGVDAAWSAFRGRHVRGRSGREAVFVGVTAFAATLESAWLVRAWDDYPGSGASEDRSAQIARGTELARRESAHIVVTPCRFEHFALLAAFGAPERALVLPSTKEPVAQSCPRVESR